MLMVCLKRFGIGFAQVILACILYEGLKDVLSRNQCLLLALLAILGIIGSIFLGDPEEIDFDDEE